MVGSQRRQRSLPVDIPESARQNSPCPSAKIEFVFLSCLWESGIHPSLSPLDRGTKILDPIVAKFSYRPILNHIHFLRATQSGLRVRERQLKASAFPSAPPFSHVRAFLSQNNGNYIPRSLLSSNLQRLISCVIRGDRKHIGVEV